MNYFLGDRVMSLEGLVFRVILFGGGEDFRLF